MCRFVLKLHLPFTIQSLRRTVVAALASGVCLAVVGSKAFAQTSIPPTSPLSVRIMDASGAILPAGSQFDAKNDLQTDLIVGQNTVGPYRLSWRNAVQGSEMVVVDGRLLQAGRDYTIDWSSGVIRFSVPLPSGELARVSYSVNTPTAERVLSASYVPLQWNFWQNDNGFLRISSLLRASDSPTSPNASDPRTYSALQFQDRFHLLPTSDLTTGLFLDMHGQDWLRRSGFLLDSMATMRGASFGLSYHRAGTLFAQQGIAGLSPGQEIIGLTGTLTPLQSLAIQLVARQTDQLTAQNANSLTDRVGTTDRTLSATLSAKLPQNGQLTAGSALETVANPQGGTATQHDMVSLSHPLAPHIDATLNFDALATAPLKESGDTTYTQSAGIDVTGSLNPGIHFDTAFTNRLTPAGFANDQKMSLTASIPIDKSQAVKVDTLYEDVLGNMGAQRNRSLLFQTPLQGLRAQLSSGVQYAGTPTNRALVGLFDLSTQPTKGLQLTGTVRLRDMRLNTGAPAPDDVNTYGVQLSYAPLPQLQFTSDLYYNPEQNGQLQKVQREDFGLQTRVGLLMLQAQLGLLHNLLSPSRSDTANFSLGFNFTPWDSLTTGLQAQNLFGGPNWTRTYLLSFTHHFNSVFDFSLSGSISYNGALGTQPQPQYTAQAQLGIHF
ncbi:hypothetical protein CTKA_00432 [Chthonomonas calidirosea]|uniref:Uncharacterized protein n=2 Tax=Chthonomonas TaxID=1077265 RepID=S0EXM4_CHTCT|nr:hypothetical protein CCALI_00723 [Chthonomonas calidirosea T49]CEK14470.1 hypothetical protein CTKA_00432 [Chthonomonas calidirosea]